MDLVTNLRMAIPSAFKIEIVTKTMKERGRYERALTKHRKLVAITQAPINLA